MKPRKGVDAEVLLKYGNHTAACAIYETVDTGGMSSRMEPANKPCNCGWDKLKKVFETDLSLHVSLPKGEKA